jgi:hypothetical protein
MQSWGEGTKVAVLTSLSGVESEVEKKYHRVVGEKRRKMP